MVNISVLAQCQTKCLPSEAEDPLESVPWLRQWDDLDSLNNFFLIMLGDQGNVIARFHQRFGLFVEDAGVEGRMDGGKDADLSTHQLTPITASAIHSGRSSSPRSSRPA
jgi:hypothetical protein